MPKHNKKPAKTNHSSKTVKSDARRIKRLSLRKLRRKRPDTPPRKLSSSFRIFVDSLSLIRQHWKLFGSIVLIYLLLSMVLVGGLGGGYDYRDLKESFTERLGEMGASVALFGILLGSVGNAGSESGTAYQTIILTVISLATIWALRQVMAGERIRVKDAFYRGMYPLIPFLLVVLVICVELIPAAIGSFVFGVVIGGGLAATGLEQALWGALVIALFALSTYLISASLFAMYVVTLPDSRPIAALKTANSLVRFRRWSVIRRLLFLPFAYILIGALIFLPLVTFAPVLLLWVFVVLSMLVLVFTHTYLYSLYRELL